MLFQALKLLKLPCETKVLYLMLSQREVIKVGAIMNPEGCLKVLLARSHDNIELIINH